ncbi:MAG: hypothetical protein ACI8RZ_001230 [Myxococcota bacterium]|jgi:hypothetical protein
MSEETDQNTDETVDETAGEASEEVAEEKGGATNRSPDNPLSRPTDAVIRPGFRNPANSRTKVQRKKRKKRR